MIYTKRFLHSATAKRLPQWIRDHTIFHFNTRIKKIFPSIGIINSSKFINHPDVKNAKIVFSSDGITGLWDIATMSMRGAMSCMHWRNPHSTHLIGSMVDPVCGIVYITDGQITDYGSSMIKRALVRMGIDDNKPFLIVDKIYAKTKNTDPLTYDNCDKFVHTTSELFVNFIQSKSKIPVYSRSNLPASLVRNAFVPQASIVSHLSWSEQSLIDCGIPYGRAKPDIIKLID